MVARIRASARANPTRLGRDAVTALYSYIDPLTGGPDGSGWPFGRPVHVGEVYSVLQRVHGVEYVEDARLFAADPITGQRGRAHRADRRGPGLPRVLVRPPGASRVSDLSTTVALAPSASNRADVPGLTSPHPFGLMLPGVYHGDAYTQAFCEALDTVLAPVLLTLDSIPAYFDPDLAPADFVEWLATWVGLEIDENCAARAPTRAARPHRGPVLAPGHDAGHHRCHRPVHRDRADPRGQRRRNLVGGAWRGGAGTAAPNVVVRLRVPAGAGL